MAGVVEVVLGRPGSVLRSLSGGTRNEIKLKRPWQSPLPHAPEDCPFCNKEREEVMTSPPDWRVLGNPFTPHPFHRLVIPRACTPPEYVQNLGGQEAIKQAFDIYATVIPVASAEGFERTVCATHVGYHGGQNLGHLHWHVCDATEPEAEIETTIRSSLKEDRVAFRQNGVVAYVEGISAGQVYLLAEDGETELTSSVLAASLSRLIALYNDKFKSEDRNLPPEYTVAVVSAGDKIRYATYVPVLNFWGFPHRLAFTGDSPVTLPWPHETTASFLNA